MAPDTGRPSGGVRASAVIGSPAASPVSQVRRTRARVLAFAPARLVAISTAYVVRPGRGNVKKNDTVVYRTIATARWLFMNQPNSTTAGINASCDILHTTLTTVIVRPPGTRPRAVPRARKGSAETKEGAVSAKRPPLSVPRALHTSTRRRPTDAPCRDQPILYGLAVAANTVGSHAAEDRARHGAQSGRDHNSADKLRLHAVCLWTRPAGGEAGGGGLMGLGYPRRPRGTGTHVLTACAPRARPCVPGRRPGAS